MKRLIIICVAVIICVAIFATPLYYEAFFKAEVASTPQATATTEIKDKYIMTSDGNRIVILNQETGSVYLVGYELKFIGDLDYLK